MFVVAIDVAFDGPSGSGSMSVVQIFRLRDEKIALPRDYFTAEEVAWGIEFRGSASDKWWNIFPWTPGSGVAFAGSSGFGVPVDQHTAPGGPDIRQFSCEFRSRLKYENINVFS
ncbi:hypothetical protein Sru01_05970 [Sphaerisporangium rufum]|uniref:Uncharacterized protein n=1 Tax=Sphaerisporangium rufum TaxID=1381558 RepID=A0A919V2T5_9ACTN|nr:hypothetical protein [Sphaerisporangium rufum]GII75615.1 hypothetical protein Sru01_05970 [Sphaerisporangium rufum]